MLYDVETDFPTEIGTYHPKNYDLKERGPFSIRTALHLSLNIPAVKALYLVGVENFLKFAERMGYTTLSDRSRFGLSVVLGGGEVKLLEHTNAYATLANEGVRHPSVSILKVTDSDARVLEEWKETAGETVVDENVARTVTNILTDDEARASVFGRGGKLTIPGRPVAAKQVQQTIIATRTRLCPQLAVGVWLKQQQQGDAKRRRRFNRGIRIWNGIMRAYLEGKPVEHLQRRKYRYVAIRRLTAKPKTNKVLLWIRLAVCLRPQIRRHGFVRTEYVMPRILYYVDRENRSAVYPRTRKKTRCMAFGNRGCRTG